MGDAAFRDEDLQQRKVVVTLSPFIKGMAGGVCWRRQPGPGTLRRTARTL
jgi:hypothetical protein